jgi:hypothetical protein
VVSLFAFQMRALWYMMMSVLENPNARNIGLVVVGYEVGDYVPVDNDMTRKMLTQCRSLPIRFVAGHTCYDETPMRKVTDLLVHMISSFFRLRYRMHCGKSCKHLSTIPLFSVSHNVIYCYT